MPRPKEFLYYILTDDGLCYYVDEMGRVLTTGTPTALQYTPDGWQEKMINYVRSDKYYGLVRSFTTPLKFVKDGAKILRHIQYNNFIEGRAWLLIQRLDPSTYVHELLYKGEFDFSQFKDEDTFVEINIMEGGVSKYLKANENTPYEITPSGAIIKMDGLALITSATWQVVDGTTTMTDPGWFVPIVLLQPNEFGVSTNTQNSIGFSSSVPGGEYIIKNETEIEQSFRLNGILGVEEAFDLVYILRMFVYNEDDDQTGTLINTGLISGPISIPLMGLGEVTLQPGERISVSVTAVSATPESPKGLIFIGSEITLSGRFQEEETSIDAIPCDLLFEELVDLATDGQYSGHSDLLEANNNYKITCGDAIRKLEGAKIKTTLNDFIKWANARFNVGVGVEGNVLRLEAKSYFFDSGTEIQDIGEVKDLKISVANQYLAKNVKVGYQSEDYEDVNGRYEFNNSQTYALPFTRITNELDLVSPYRSDMYGIEFTRINLDGKATTDSTADNDTFVIVTEPDSILDESGLFSYYELDRSLNAGATGLSDVDTAFNIAASPKRCFNEHAAWFRSMLYQMDSLRVTFQTTEKNRDLVAGGVTENADVLVNTMGDRLFLPYIAEFEGRASSSTIEAIENSPSGYFTATYDGITLKGYLLEVGIKPGTREADGWKLLLTPDNTLTDLIQ